MREILFRGLHDGNKWYYGDFCSRPEPHIMFFNDAGELDVAPCPINTVGQFTGYLDSQGRKIFDGDILNMHTKNSQSTMEVSMEDGCWVGIGIFNTHPLKDYITAQDFESIDIYENIHEN